MFVKFGQIGSTRSDLLAAPVIGELSQLRSSVREIPDDQVRPLIEGELGRPIEEVFASFEWRPLAAASIGQTHRAVLSTGQHVVVKGATAGYGRASPPDGTVLRVGASIADRRVPAARRLGLKALAEELVLGMERALDYLREASMSKRMTLDVPDNDAVRIPVVFEELSTTRLSSGHPRRDPDDGTLWARRPAVDDFTVTGPPHAGGDAADHRSAVRLRSRGNRAREGARQRRQLGGKRAAAARAPPFPTGPAGTPRDVDELATQLRSGRLTVRVDRFSGQDERVVGRGGGAGR